MIAIDNIQGVNLFPLKIIEGEMGAVFHAIKKTDTGFSEFGEAYFSIVNPGMIKGWKRHNIMILNIIVPVGEIEFAVFDDRPNSVTKGKWGKINLSTQNYHRLNVQPGLWMSFKGISKSMNLLLNVSNIVHSPAESDNLPLNHPDMPDIWRTK
ncbi:MAG: dTDP-4-dehydrorhamnose 3,5-epimerase family protein [Spirochaetia bacterium]|nr:dTDP-4-dehydrorhamnose 3,5-epimerase family protein [Spirochaetia bacterium]